MKKQSVIFGITALVMMISTNVTYAKKWNNPENQRRYNQAQTRAAEAYRNESKAWQNYDHELARAQKDVRRVRNEAIKGAVKGGPAGAAWGAAKGAAIGIGERGRHNFRNH